MNRRRGDDVSRICWSSPDSVSRRSPTSRKRPISAERFRLDHNRWGRISLGHWRPDGSSFCCTVSQMASPARSNLARRLASPWRGT